MLHNHNRDLSIGSYVLIGATTIGVELFGLDATLRVGLTVAAVGVGATLVLAAIHHLRRNKQRRKRDGDWAIRLKAAMSPA